MTALPAFPLRIDADSDDPARGLAALVVAILDVLRQVLERQALRRVEGGGHSEAEVERLGLALEALEARMSELRRSLVERPDDVDHRHHEEF